MNQLKHDLLWYALLGTCVIWSAAQFLTLIHMIIVLWKP